MTSTHQISERFASRAKILDPEESYALIARFVKAGERITQNQLQEAQRRYVKTPDELIALLERDIRIISVEVETLTREIQQISPVHSLSSIADQYFGHLFTNNLLGYMREVAVADVMFNEEYGPEAVVRFWCLSQWFGDVAVEVEEFQTRDCNTLVVATTTRVTITNKTLRIVFPNLCTANNKTIASRLINRRLVLRGSTRFEWDHSTRLVTRILSQTDMVTPMLELLGNLEDVSKVFEKALISPEFQWRF
ncbi:hypothetical protein DVH05_026733 [Phytophthora capsici]|nr:hypothetical protein DVH05_026733 [Phytophthora capsici]